MITSGEIREFALTEGVRQEVIEKDYVLGWILAGTYNITESENWIFKGGTALKKCYFYNYRFSEDLDFSLEDPDGLREECLKVVLNKIIDWVYDNSGIEISKTKSIIETFQNSDLRQIAQIRLYYHGPVGPSSPQQWPRIKYDLTGGELITDKPILRKVYHPYSDNNEELFKTRCYSFTEVFAEKLRALVQRTRPRDIYDVVKCYEAQMVDFSEVKAQFILKMQAKSLLMPTKDTLLAQIKNSNVFWVEQLAHQINNLEDFEEFEQKMMSILEHLISF